MSVTINADNDSPTAEAGVDQVVDEERSGNTSARFGVVDPENQGLTYQWIQTGGPAVTLSDATAD